MLHGGSSLFGIDISKGVQRQSESDKFVTKANNSRVLDTLASNLESEILSHGTVYTFDDEDDVSKQSLPEKVKSNSRDSDSLDSVFDGFKHVADSKEHQRGI